MQNNLEQDVIKKKFYYKHQEDLSRSTSTRYSGLSSSSRFSNASTLTSQSVTISAVAKLKAGMAKQEKEKLNVTQHGRFINKPPEPKSILKNSPGRSLDELEKEIERE